MTAPEFASSLRSSQRRQLLRRLRRHMMAILRGRMRGGETRAPRAEQFFAQRPRLVVLLVASALDQFRHQNVGDILKVAGRYRERNVQSVDVGLLEPRFDIVGD